MNSAAWTNTFPAHWRRVRLKNLVASITAGVWGEEPAEDEGVVCVRAADFDREHLRVSMTKVPLRKVTPEQFGACALAPSDLVLEKSGGGDRQPVGAVVLFDHDIHAVPTNFAARIRPHPTVNPRFLNYVFGATYALRLNVRSIKQTTGLQNLDVGSFLAEEWAIPSLTHQVRIADFLDYETARIDALVEQKRLLLERLQERRQSVIFHGITGLIGEDAEVHDPGLPWARATRKPWPPVKIKHVARLGTGHTPSRSRPELWENCTIPWITTGEIQQVRDDRVEVITETREKISEIGIANSAAVLHPAGTVVLCRTASAGFSAIMGTDMATSQDFATWTCSGRLLPRYLLMCLRAMRRDLLGRLAFGSTHKTIYMPEIEDLKIPLPGVDDQQQVLAAIDSRLAKIDALTKRLEGQLALLAEHRKVLITAAVAGQIDVSAKVA